MANVAPFTTTLSPQKARSINVRGSTLSAPGNGDYAEYLRQTLMSQLTAAGKLSGNGAVTIGATLTEAEVNENMSTGSAALGARFVVSKNGTNVFDKNIRVSGNFKSNFIGAIAIPETFLQFNALFPKLIDQLTLDPDFIKAIQASP
jgi:hypothetical protein